MTEKQTITQAGLKILENFFAKLGVKGVSVPGPDGKPAIEPGPTVISGVDKHPERIGGGKGLQHPDSDGEPR